MDSVERAGATECESVKIRAREHERDRSGVREGRREEGETIDR